MERCRQCDPQGSDESAQKADSSLDRVIKQSVRVLVDKLFEQIRVSRPSQILFFFNTFFKDQCLKQMSGRMAQRAGFRATMQETQVQFPEH